MPTIYIDADACPVKDEVYQLAGRKGLLVYVVANQWLRMPDDPMIRLEVVDDGFDAADDWIAARVQPGDVVVSDDIPLAARCIDAGARVITPRGMIRDTGNIGEALAMRELMQYVRDSGEVAGRQKPMQASDRRYFRQQIDMLL